MTKLTKCTAVSMAAIALAAAGSAQGRSSHFSLYGPAAQHLRASMLRAGELANFATLDCPTSVAAATDWANGNSSTSAALAAEGFQVGIREPLRSARLDGLAFDSGARFATAEGAREALARVAAGLRSRNGASLRVQGIPGAIAYRLSTSGAWQYSVVFVAGNVEHSIDVTLPRPAPASFTQQLAQAARTVYARS
jgi:hypothetical protein